mmetsp:Transcript_267/g.511  ORF Transcript_267/g.511 Transcript_267/m.511 type:complete len:243 (+) Transcript_267:199-927(+)
MSEEVVELDRLNLIDVDRTLFRSGEFMLALHDALLSTVDRDLPSREQVVQDISAESLPFAKYYYNKGIQLNMLYTATKTLKELYVYEDVDILGELPGRVMLYTKGERDTQEVKLHHSGLSKKVKGQTKYDETSKPGVWIVQTNKGELLSKAIDQDASNTNIVVLRWNNVEYRAKELIFVDDKYGEIKPLVDLARSGIPLYMAHIVRKDAKYGAADDRDESIVVEIETLRDLEAKLQEMRNRR